MSTSLKPKIVGLIEIMGFAQVAEDVRNGTNTPEEALLFLSKSPLNSAKFREIARVAHQALTRPGTVDLASLRGTLGLK